MLYKVVSLKKNKKIKVFFTKMDFRNGEGRSLKLISANAQR